MDRSHPTPPDACRAVSQGGAGPPPSLAHARGKETLLRGVTGGQGEGGLAPQQESGESGRRNVSEEVLLQDLLRRLQALEELERGKLSSMVRVGGMAWGAGRVMTLCVLTLPYTMWLIYYHIKHSRKPQLIGIAWGISVLCTSLLEQVCYGMKLCLAGQD